MSAGTALQGILLTHRVCAPEHQAITYRLCRTDRRVLPRFHQDDRGRRNASRGYHDVAPAGAYSGIAAWTNREHFLDLVIEQAIRLRPDVLARRKVSPDMFRRVYLVKSGYAQQRSGRRCIVRPVTVASVVGTHERTVERCAQAARDLGIEVVIREGRMLNEDERGRCRANGSRQRGLSTEVALTVPRWLQPAVERAAVIVDTAAPPKRLGKPRKITTVGTSVTAFGRSRGTALRAGTQKRPSPDRCRVLSAASELARRLPWLATEGRKRLAPTITRFISAPEPWTAAQLVTAITRISADRGPIHEGMIRTRPVALLAALLRRLDPIQDHPGPDGPLCPPPPAPPAPCGGTDCDGHGWINLTTAAGYRAAHPCPDCPSTIRRGEHHAFLASSADDSVPF